jgi:hypothetical protein
MRLLQQLTDVFSKQDATASSPSVELIGAGQLSSVFAVTDLAAAAVGSAAVATARLIAARWDQSPRVLIDRRLTSMWFATSIRPEGWTIAPVRDLLSGDYRTVDGWIRIHANAPPHRAAALAVLGVRPRKEAVIESVADWNADALETAIIEAGGCAATMRSLTEWATHPQGKSVADEPLFHVRMTDACAKVEWPGQRARPLRGIRVLDLTRVIAAPVATRFLAGLGADVLRIDPPRWEEPGVVPDVTLGKRCARLDLQESPGGARFCRLLSQADIFVHGLRPGALARLGFDAEVRRKIRPGLVDVSLDAYGWSGPWAKRRGFDSLVQMSCGIAEAGMRQMSRDEPAPLPVQALDHATGYLMAAAAIHGLIDRLTRRCGSEWRTSLAATAAVLVGYPTDPSAKTLSPEQASDFIEKLELTTWGPACRLKPPVSIEGVPIFWERPAGELGVAEAEFSDLFS